MDRSIARAAWFVITCVAGCAGNGQGLDQNGEPNGMGASPAGGAGNTGGTATAPAGAVTADFQSIQDNVFTPICAKCHVGGSAPEGLQLDAAHSYDLLVGVPSAEQPTFDRIKAGDPDDSYLVQKIEGAPGIDGGQMPLGETPLPAATIAAIKQWVSDGAANSSVAAAAASVNAGKFAVRITVPATGAGANASATLLVAFTRDVDATLVNDSTVMLERMVEPQRLIAMPAVLRMARGNGAVMLIKPSTALNPGAYRLTLRGAGGGALADMNATTLGADVHVDFAVQATP